MPLLQCQKVSKAFGGVSVLSSVSISVEGGQLYGIIGPNGAGKTTLASCISGGQRFDGGEVYFLNRDITRMNADAICRAGLARTFQTPQLLSDKSVLENVMIGHHVRGRSGVMSAILRLPRGRKEDASCYAEATESLDFLGCAALADVPARNLSAGQQRLVSVARALVSRPALLLLDEPAAGLNETEVARLGATLQMIREAGTTVVVIEHHVDLIMEVCDWVAVLSYGSLIAEGAPAQVRRDQRVITAYLGVQT